MVGFKNTLLGVDPQNDFCFGGALAVAKGDEVVDPLNRIMDFADKFRMIGFADKFKWLILLSRDWHPENSDHFKKWGVHCVQYSHGAQFHPRLKIPKRAYIINKGTGISEDGYSPFSGTIYDRPMEEFIWAANSQKIYIGGLATDYCVKAAALDARERGYAVYLLTDACRAVNLNPGDEEKALHEMRDAGVIFTTTEEVIKEADNITIGNQGGAG